MKQLQRDFTTHEQFKRLLKLGVPADSADCYIGKDNKVHVINGDIPKSLIYSVGCVPCWSVGRLIEIFEICTGTKYQKRFANKPWLYDVIWQIDAIINKKLLICTEIMDFSKLEDYE